MINIESKQKILLTAPKVGSLGGVSSYVGSLLAYMGASGVDVDVIEVGSSSSNGTYFSPFHDQVEFNKKLNNKYDCVHLNPSLNVKSLIRDGLFLMQAKKKGFPVLVFFHGWNRSTEKKIDALFKKVFKLAYGRADAFLVLASDFRRKLREWGIESPIFLETTSVNDSLLDGFNLDDVLAKRQSKGGTKVLFLARLEEEKGIFETIDAVVEVFKHNKKISLTIAGDGAAKKGVESKILDLKTEGEFVSYVGFVDGDKKKSLFVEHDIYCFPTAYGEGLPTSVIEAMAFALPVITTNVGGLADHFQDKAMGRLVRPRSTYDVVEKIEWLIRHKDEKERISRFNYNHAAKNFLASVVSKRVLIIYEKIQGIH